MAPRKITSLKGKVVTEVLSSGLYVIIRFGRGQELQVHVDAAFDKDGMIYANDAPNLPPPLSRARP